MSPEKYDELYSIDSAISPGTGKTTTLLEAMKQLLDRDKNCRILACAPSNSAADLIAEKMMYLGTNALFRLNSFARPVDLLLQKKEMLKPYCLINDNTVFAVPPLEVLRAYRLVVSTCVSGGIPSGLGFARGHFTHIFIDEAGQATEPEAMVRIEIVMLRCEAECQFGRFRSRLWRTIRQI